MVCTVASVDFHQLVDHNFPAPPYQGMPSPTSHVAGSPGPTRRWGRKPEVSIGQPGSIQKPVREGALVDDAVVSTQVPEAHRGLLVSGDHGVHLPVAGHCGRRRGREHLHCAAHRSSLKPGHVELLFPGRIEERHGVLRKGLGAAYLALQAVTKGAPYKGLYDLE